MKRTHIIILLLAGFLTSCVGDKKVVERTVVQNNGDQNWTPNPSGTVTPTPTATPTNNSNIDYYTIGSQVVHGNDDGVVVWSSAEHLPDDIPASAFDTDAKFAVQIRPRISTHNGYDVDDNKCYFNSQHTKVRMKVRVRRPGVNSGQICYFTADVDQKSQIVNFNIPQGYGAPTPVVEVVYYQTNRDCLGCAYRSGSTKTQCEAQNCPFYSAGKNDCVSFDMFVATDYTKDLQGTLKDCHDY